MEKTGTESRDWKEQAKELLKDHLGRPEKPDWFSKYMSVSRRRFLVGIILGLFGCLLPYDSSFVQTVVLRIKTESAYGNIAAYILIPLICFLVLRWWYPKLHKKFPSEWFYYAGVASLRVVIWPFPVFTAICVVLFFATCMGIFQGSPLLVLFMLSLSILFHWVFLRMFRLMPVFRERRRVFVDV